MNKRILFTGGTGFIGRNVLPILREQFEVDAPRRNELNLSNPESVKGYLAQSQSTVLVHAAICTPSNEADREKNVLHDVISSFLLLANHPFEKIIFVGSGAEFDKSKNIVEVTEDDLGKNVPLDDYGLAKYMLTQYARCSANVYNARIFGCYGPTEPERRFIRHAIDCCLNNLPITIRQDCRFSYVNVADLGRAIIKMIVSTPRHHDYNVVGDSPHLLSELACEVRSQIGCDVPIQIMTKGFANEYSARGDRIMKEFSDLNFTSIESGISQEIKSLS